MFAIERIRIIKNQLLKEKKISVAHMSEFLGVTEVTIRRDLEKLEKEGFLKRTHGGAVLMAPYEENVTEDAKDEYAASRVEIAETAFHLIEDGDTVMLLDGHTNLQIARKLTEKSHLTVITNDLRIGLEFSSYPNIHLITLGGDLDGTCSYGQMALSNMSNFSFNHLFIEADGIHETSVVTVTSINKATLIQNAIPLADSATLVSLSGNFGHKSLFRATGLSAFSRIITDSSLDDSHKDTIYNLNIPLFTSVDVFEH